MEPNSAPRRKSIRLPGYDYSEPGAYFVTICTARHRSIFSVIVDGVVQLTPIGRIVEKCWLDIPNHFHRAQLDAHIIMPNHIHGVILIEPNCGANKGEAFPTGIVRLDQNPGSSAPPQHVPCPGGNASPLRPVGTTSGSLGAIIQNFKAVTTRRVNQLNRTPGGILWQRNYYEHIVRYNDKLDEIRQYILANPWNWPKDKYYINL